MDHLITDGGRFQRACVSLLALHPAILYSDRGLDEDEKRKKKLASKTKYTCPSCCLNAWAKPAGFCCKNLTSLAKGLGEPWVRKR
jgi:hypothetical protein